MKMQRSPKHCHMTCPPMSLHQRHETSFHNSRRHHSQKKFEERFLQQIYTRHRDLMEYRASSGANCGRYSKASFWSSSKNSLDQSHLPRAWRAAKIVPLRKGGKDRSYKKAENLQTDFVAVNPRKGYGIHHSFRQLRGRFSPA